MNHSQPVFPLRPVAGNGTCLGIPIHCVDAPFGTQSIKQSTGVSAPSEGGIHKDAVFTGIQCLNHLCRHNGGVGCGQHDSVALQ